MAVWTRARGWSRRRTALTLVAVLVVAGGVGTWLVVRPSEAATTTPTATVTSGTFSTTVSASGTITPARESDLSFPSGGTVTTVLVAEGDTVKKGQALARMDGAAVVATRDAAQATLDAAEAQLDDDVDAGASDTQLASDRAQVAAATSSLASAQDDVDDTTLRAPFAGTVSAVGVAVGDSTGSSAGSGSTGGSPTGTSTTTSADSGAITVISTSSYVVDATVGASDVTQLKKGMQAEITPTGADSAVYGVVSAVGVVAQQSDGTTGSSSAQFPVTIRVTGATKGLYAGSSADVVVTVKEVADVLTVPTQAVRTTDGKTYVTKVVDGKGVRTTITIGETYGMQTEVTKGLAEGDVVRLSGFSVPGGSGTGRNGGQQGEGGSPGGMPTGMPQGGAGGFGGPQ